MRKLAGVTALLGQDIKRNLVKYLVVLFVFMVGLTSGFFTLGALPSQQGSMGLFLGAFFNTIKSVRLDFGAIIFQSVLGNALLFALITLAGLWPVCAPVSALALVFKGFTMGFSVCALFSAFGLSGIIAVLIGVLLPGALMVPCFLKCASLSADECVLRLRLRKSYAKQDRIKYLSNVLNSFLVALVAIIIESVAVPPLLKLFAGAIAGQ